MDTSQWIGAIKGAAADPDGDQMHALAQQLSACEQAKTLLRENGYGDAGVAIDKMVLEVLRAARQ